MKPLENYIKIRILYCPVQDCLKQGDALLFFCLFLFCRRN